MSKVYKACQVDDMVDFYRTGNEYDVSSNGMGGGMGGRRGQWQRIQGRQYRVSTGRFCTIEGEH